MRRCASRFKRECVTPTLRFCYDGRDFLPMNDRKENDDSFGPAKVVWVYGGEWGCLETQRSNTPIHYALLFEGQGWVVIHYPMHQSQTRKCITLAIKKGVYSSLITMTIACSRRPEWLHLIDDRCYKRAPGSQSPGQCQTA